MSYRVFLQDEYTKRLLKNPRYSLRAFARDLAMAPSSLSEVMNGKGGISLAQARKIGRALSLQEDSLSYFCALVEAESGRSATRRAAAKSKIKALSRFLPYHSLSLDSFKVIADWYHLAIMEAIRIKGFFDSWSKSAARLGIAPLQLQEAIKRLQSMNLLQVSDEGPRLVNDNSSVPGGASKASFATREFQRQLAVKGCQALVDTPPELLEFITLLAAIPREKIPQAKTMLQEFVREFDAEMQRDKALDVLYCLNVQFFRLDQDLASMAKDALPSERQ